MPTDLTQGEKQLQLKQLQIQASREAAERERALAKRERAQMTENVKLSVKRTNESVKHYVRQLKLKGKLMSKATRETAQEVARVMEFQLNLERTQAETAKV